MPRAGLTTERVVEAAAEMVDEVGPEALTLAALALRLGVRQPSLYKHIESLDSLRQRVAIRAKLELVAVLSHAAIGRSRDGALVSLAHAYRRWALKHPGLYQAAQRPPATGDLVDEAVSAEAVAVLTAVMDGYGLSGDETVDAIRAFRALVHGFISLEIAGDFALPASVDRSYDHLIEVLTHSLARPCETAQPRGSELP